MRNLYAGDWRKSMKTLFIFRDTPHRCGPIWVETTRTQWDFPMVRPSEFCRWSRCPRLAPACPRRESLGASQQPKYLEWDSHCLWLYSPEGERVGSVKIGFSAPWLGFSQLSILLYSFYIRGFCIWNSNPVVLEDYSRHIIGFMDFNHWNDDANVCSKFQTSYPPVPNPEWQPREAEVVAYLRWVACQVGLATFVFLVPEAVLGSESAAPAPKYASFSGENNDKALDGMRYGNYPIFKQSFETR